MSVAVSADPRGPFKFHKAVYPHDNCAGDITVFVDPNEPSACYLIYSIRPKMTAGPFKPVSTKVATAKRKDKPARSIIVARLTVRAPNAGYAHAMPLPSTSKRTLSTLPQV